MLEYVAIGVTVGVDKTGCERLPSAIDDGLALAGFELADVGDQPVIYTHATRKRRRARAVDDLYVADQEARRVVATNGDLFLRTGAE